MHQRVLMSTNVCGVVCLQQHKYHQLRGRRRNGGMILTGSWATQCAPATWTDTLHLLQPRMLWTCQNAHPQHPERSGGHHRELWQTTHANMGPRGQWVVLANLNQHGGLSRQGEGREVGGGRCFEVSWGGADASKPIGAAAKFPGVREKLFPCPIVG